MRLLPVPILVGLVLLGSAASVSAQSEMAATLSGNNEVPMVNTIGFGSTTFDVNVSGGVIGVNYELVVNNVTDAFMAHIHCGMPGENGPVMAFLAGPTPGTGAQDLNGVWVRAKLTEKSITSTTTACGVTLFDMITAMASGRMYVNVHTRANAGGEIRGQISLVAPFTIP